MTRHKLSMLILLILMLLLMGQAVYAQGGTQTANLRIDGMVWPICERTAESVLGRLDGVVKADADFRTGRAVVTYDPAQINPEQIVQAFNSQSFYRASVAAGEGGSATTIESRTGPEAQPASSSGAADVVYTAIGYGKYVLWGLVGLALALLGWRVVGKRLLRVQIRTTEK